MIDHRSSCALWIGAISGRGHGRFWIARGHVIVAHRFAWALAHSADPLNAGQVLAHECDEPLCQNAEHLTCTTPGENTRQWATRRLAFAGPQADPRGARARAEALRELLTSGTSIPDALDAQRGELERYQLTLF